MLEQVSAADWPRFLTLTYKDEGDFDASKMGVWVRSLRDSGFRCRYFGTSERGTRTGRLHHHVLYWGEGDDDILRSRWRHGFVGMRHVFSAGAFAYVAKYTHKALTVEGGTRYSKSIGGEAAAHWADEMKFRWQVGEYHKGKLPLPYAVFNMQGQRQKIWIPENRYKSLLRDLGVFTETPRVKSKDYEDWGFQMRQLIEKQENEEWRSVLTAFYMRAQGLEMEVRASQLSASPYS